MSSVWNGSLAPPFIYARLPMSSNGKTSTFRCWLKTSTLAIQRVVCCSTCWEPLIRVERQMDGIQKAKERGVSFGRKKKLTREQSDQLRRRREQGKLIKILMKDYNLSKASVYRYLGKAVENSGYSLECTFSGRCAKNPTDQ